MMKHIAQTPKQYTIRYKYDVTEIDTPIFTAGSHGLDEQQAKENFLHQYPTTIIISCHEVKLKR